MSPSLQSVRDMGSEKLTVYSTYIQLYIVILYMCSSHLSLLDVPKQPTCMNGRYRELHQQLQSRLGARGQNGTRAQTNPRKSSSIILPRAIVMRTCVNERGAVQKIYHSGSIQVLVKYKKQEKKAERTVQEKVK